MILEQDTHRDEYGGHTKKVTVLLCCLWALSGGPSSAAPPLGVAKSLTIEPARIHLTGARARQQVVVTGMSDDNRTLDLTSTATYRSFDPQVAEVTESGIVLARGDGETSVVATFDGLSARAEIRVEGSATVTPIDFRTEVVAAFGRAGCNQGVCHGSPKGKNGFRLSLRGFNPQLDYFTLTREALGRRTGSSEAEKSLVLLKGLGRVPHEGGVRFDQTDPAYRVLRTWIEEGRLDSARPLELLDLEVLPSRRRLHSSLRRQQLIVLAHFSDNSVRDVTPLCVYTTNDESTAAVDADGLVEFLKTGEVAILARYLDELASVRLSYVNDDPGFVFSAPHEENYVDRHVFARLRELHLNPAPLASDEVFLRRVYLDAIGALPTPLEARAFLDSEDPERRAKLIDQLLERDEFSSFWALKWADVMRGNRETISERGVHGLHRLLEQQFATDRPFDTFARDILTSVGNTDRRPAANFFRISRKPEEAAESMSQLFLGVRIQCAKCHNHPYETFTQEDYYGLAAYFARVRLKGRQFGRDDETVYLAPSGTVTHPGTGKPQPAAAFGTPAGELEPGQDPRDRLVDWLVDPQNPYFAKSTVNRIWFHLFGRGIVNPVDDFRASNPPSNDTLIDTLADHFARDGYRFKPLIRTILKSSTYQLDSVRRPSAKTNSDGADPEKYFAVASIRMHTAEQILDATSTALGVPESFPGYPIGTRAIELAEGAVSHHFLKAFSKPIRDVSCDCARETEPSLNEVIHLLNNPSLLSRLSHPSGRVAQWLEAGKESDEVAELIYLATVSRYPTATEKRIARTHIASVGDTAAGLRDLQHALMNSNEFLLRH